MTLPIPPSDSLYKFTAIGGVILVVLSLYLPWKLGSDLLIANLDLLLDLEKQAPGYRELHHDLQDMGVFAQGVLKDLVELEKTCIKNKESFNPSEMCNRNKWNADFLRRLKEAESKQSELELLLLQSKYTTKKVDLLALDARRLTWISRLTLGLGVIMTVFGFWNWYFKFQRYQDRIIKAQAEPKTPPETMERGKEEIPG